MPVQPPPPPAILIFWSEDDQRWLATAVRGAVMPARAIGASTADGATPAGALDALFEKRFCLGSFDATFIYMTVAA